MPFNAFKHYTSQFGHISSQEWSQLINIATPITLKKEALITQSDERFNKEVFVEKGIIRGFIIDEAGNEKSTSFFIEGGFMSTTSLRNNNGHSLYNYQALCYSELLYFNAAEIRHFFSRNKVLTQIGKDIKEREIQRIRERDSCLLQTNAKDKYQAFISHYPNLESFISQKHIASYLGITPVSLSRIKSHKTDNI
ncbi:MAG: Crp/Fnr family transcriptional regulator [Chitinophagales bacterium]|nr:Crp/Fnr family transcriptional regulator [Chitinophagales bacterium]